MSSLLTKLIRGRASQNVFGRPFSSQTYTMSSSTTGNKQFIASNSKSDLRAEFKSLFPRIVQTAIHDPKLKPVLVKHYQKVLEYNAPHGKHIRGLLTVEMYRELKKGQLTEKEVYLSQVVGWCIELLHGFHLVTDDIMDGSSTRRGQPCWYLQPDSGLSGFNDSLLLEAAVYKLLKRECSDRPYYVNLVQLFHEVSLKTTYGQCLDMLCCNSSNPFNMDNYTPQNHAAIVEYKTSYYTFVLPITAAMYLAGIEDPKLHQQEMDLLQKIGYLFQVQDDFMDCFGDPSHTGKTGTDIQEGKCSWLVVNAIQRCDANQKKLIMNNYRRHDDESVKIIKKIYMDLELPSLYCKFENEEYEKAMSIIKHPTFKLPSSVFENILNKLRHQKNRIS